MALPLASMPVINCQSCRSCVSLQDQLSRLVVCQTCGNKRCPKATHHVHACTGSNEPGQKGSVYE